jgi:hypothetical protein
MVKAQRTALITSAVNPDTVMTINGSPKDEGIVSGVRDRFQDGKPHKKTAAEMTGAVGPYRRGCQRLAEVRMSASLRRWRWRRTTNHQPIITGTMVRAIKTMRKNKTL